MNTHTSLVCAYCNEEIPAQLPQSITTGYGRDKDNNIVCYSCCAELDCVQMHKEGKIVLYLTIDPQWQVKRATVRNVWNGRYFGTRTLPRDVAKIGNWPDSLQFVPSRLQWSVHNWGIPRYDVWFAYDGYYWHGVKIGNDTDLLHCKRTKERTEDNPAPKRHYVGMAGLHGYMPNYVTVGETRGSVAEDLGFIHELSDRAIKRMRRDCYYELDLYEHGNEYCEITECDCGKSIEAHADDPM